MTKMRWPTDGRSQRALDLDVNAHLSHSKMTLTKRCSSRCFRVGNGFATRAATYVPSPSCRPNISIQLLSCHIATFKRSKYCAKLTISNWTNWEMSRIRRWPNGFSGEKRFGFLIDLRLNLIKSTFFCCRIKRMPLNLCEQIKKWGGGWWYGSFRACNTKEKIRTETYRMHFI